MLAGLIKTDQGKGSSGIPFLSRLPVIGALFGKQNRSNNRQEILVLVTPTILNNPADARKLTDDYGARFRHWSLCAKNVRKPPRNNEARLSFGFPGIAAP